MKGRSCTSTHGFTLVEIQIAMVLLALIVLLGHGSLMFHLRNWHTATSQLATLETQHLVSQFLRRQLEQSMPLVWLEEDRQQVVLTGDTQGLIFAGRLPSHRGLHGPAMIRIDQHEQALRFSWRSLLDRNASSGHGFMNEDRTEVLLDDIADIEFSYYGQVHADDPPGWHASWHAETQLPQLIRLRIQPNATPAWPDIVIAHRARFQPGRPELHVSSTGFPLARE